MKAIAAIIILCGLYSCQKDCISTIETMQQNHTYTATQQGEVSATVDGCHGVYIYVNGTKAAGSTAYFATVNAHVNGGDTWKVTSSCTDAGVVVKYRTLCE